MCVYCAYFFIYDIFIVKMLFKKEVNIYQIPTIVRYYTSSWGYNNEQDRHNFCSRDAYYLGEGTHMKQKLLCIIA